jgi:hypothetical protein
MRSLLIMIGEDRMSRSARPIENSPTGQAGYRR